MSKEFKVALFIVVSAIILYIGVNYLKGIDFLSSSNKYYAIYNNVDGLKVSNSVVVNGFSIGRVNDISILQNNKNRVLVELDVDKNIILNDSTLAILINSDFLGSKAIVLNIGNSSNPIHDGDTINSEIDKGLAAILENAQPITDNIDITIRRINEILLGMEGAGEEIKQAINNINKTLKIVNGLISENQNSIKGTLENIQILTKNLNSKVNKLSPILNKADSALLKINNIEFEKILTSITELLNELTKITKDINTGKGTLGKMVKEDSLYNNLNKTMLDLDKLLIHFNENPKHFMAPLGKSKKKIDKDNRR